MNAINKRTRVLLVIAAAGLLILTGVSIITPWHRTWTEQARQIHERELTVKKGRALTREKPALEKKFSDISKKIQARLPSLHRESTFLSAIGEVAATTDVHIETMNPRPFRDIGFFKELSVEIKMEANLGNLARFLYEMRKSSVVLVANRLALEPKSERSALLKGDLVISTIFLKEN